MQQPRDLIVTSCYLSIHFHSNALSHKIPLSFFIYLEFLAFFNVHIFLSNISFYNILVLVERREYKISNFLYKTLIFLGKMSGVQIVRSPVRQNVQQKTGLPREFPKEFSRKVHNHLMYLHLLASLIIIPPSQGLRPCKSHPPAVLCVLSLQRTLAIKMIRMLSGLQHTL